MTPLTLPIDDVNKQIQEPTCPAAPVRTQRLSPILKWAGGKEQELKYILPNLPCEFVHFYEPFVGGGAVYTSIGAQHYFINDKSDELIALYRSLTGSNRQQFFEASDEIAHNWKLLSDVVRRNFIIFIELYREYSADAISEDKLRQTLLSFIISHSAEFNGMFSDKFNFNTPNFLHELQINLNRKISRMKQLERAKHRLPDEDVCDNIETSLKSAFYMHFRHILNHVDEYKVSLPVLSAIFLFIRNFAYSGMFRYNSSGDFNVPYGGIGYNRKDYQKKLNYLKSDGLRALLDNTSIANQDFEEFLRSRAPSRQDFVFLDPPYDSDFSTYAKNEFTKDDQIRLANYLKKECAASWMLVIKNTEFIWSLYSGKELNIMLFNKKYLVSFMNRNDKNAEHLLITNY